jgi:pimeloyl-ACP methyl ester carboxylesterase
VTARRGGGRAVRRLRALVGAFALIVAACGGPGPVPATPPPSTGPTSSQVPGSSAAAAASPGNVQQAAVAPIAWSDCGAGFQCGALTVPLDYAKPDGASLRVSVIRLPASDRSARIGSLVIEPGGPGESGTDFARSAAKSLFSDEIRSHFDIVGFDPRGVNESSPIRCSDDLDHFLAVDQTPDTAQEVSALLAGEKAFVEGCQRRNADVLAHVGTDDVVRDLDRLRQALADAKLDYLGFSYGTLIGALYAQAYPDHIRSMVLDGAMDPSLDLAAIGAGQAAGFEADLRDFLAWCARNTGCAFRHKGKPGPAFEALMRRIESKPLPAASIGSERLVGPTYAWEAVAGAMYDTSSWPLLAVSLAAAERGDGSDLLLLSDPLSGRKPDGGYSNLVDSNLAITCLDFPAPRNPAPYEAEARAWAKTAPHFGALIAYGDIGCAYWPVAPLRRPAPVSAPTAPPILIVGSTRDPATPYPWAVALSHQLTSSVLLTRVGDGHTGYAASECVAQAADAYLIGLTIPHDRTCPD